MDTYNKEKIAVYEIIKKSEMKAKTIYEYKKICQSKEYFVPCELEESKEELKLTYCIDYMENMTNIKRETQMHILAVLINVSSLELIKEKYRFSLSPKNLYYDANYCVKIKIRDIYDESEVREDDFIKEYKSLIGYALQKKYNYDDYKDGGLEILKKNSALKDIYEAETVEDIKKCLHEKYTKVQQMMQQTKVIVSKKGRKNIKIYASICSIILIAALIGLFYLNFNVIPKERALIKAANSFIELDYISVIDSLEEISEQELEVHAKYMLSVSYVKAENLSMEQKNNILADMSVTSDVKILDYWIYLGRLNTVEAVNIALQSSNDELLLYAYLKEKSMLENDATLDGTSKIEKLSQIESKIQEITKKYEEK